MRKKNQDLPVRQSPAFFAAVSVAVATGSGDFYREEDSLSIPHNPQSHRIPRLEISCGLNKIRCISDARIVESANDIARMNTGICGRSIGLDLGHKSAGSK